MSGLPTASKYNVLHVLCKQPEHALRVGEKGLRSA